MSWWQWIIVVIGVIIYILYKIVKSNGNNNGSNHKKNSGMHAIVGPVTYSEREIPDDSEEARQIRAKQNAVKGETLEQRLKRLSYESRQRMESVGLSMYIWETSGDERVRSSHELMDGLLCRWADPTVYSRNKGKDWIPRPEGAALTHPGEEDGCRCCALSYLDEIVGEV
jgi:uncharacterized protein with gpF-like domain